MALSMASAQTDRGSMRIHTNNVRECRDYFRAVEGGTHFFDIARPPSFGDFEHHEWALGRISLNRIDISCASDFTVTKSAPVPYFQFNFVLEGACEVKGRHGRLVAKPGDIFVVDPEQSATELWQSRMLQYLLRIERRVVENALAAELGVGLSKHLVFDPVTPDPGIGAWLHQIANGCVDGAGAALMANRRVAKSIEDTLIAMVLAGFHHSESEVLARKSPSVAPYYVKRAEEHIRLHAPQRSVDRKHRRRRQGQPAHAVLRLQALAREVADGLCARIAPRPGTQGTGAGPGGRNHGQQGRDQRRLHQFQPVFPYLQSPFRGDAIGHVARPLGRAWLPGIVARSSQSLRSPTSLGPRLPPLLPGRPGHDHATTATRRRRGAPSSRAIARRVCR